MKRSLFVLVLLSFAALAHAQADCSTLTFLNESIPEGTVGVPYQFQLEAVGGTAPYTFTIIDGALPAGLHLNKNGRLHGKPREVADNTVLIRLEDANGCVVNQAFPVRVNP
ncbi:MAG TPA: Ig domain-containing protein [Thermoanaerobaculia bacterium]|nr:Ig domain-containing protein [Thermoanaerobaculia bacterium]